MTVTLPTMDHWWSSFWCMPRGGSVSESARQGPSLPSFVLLTAVCSDCSGIEHHIPTFTMLTTRYVYRRCSPCIRDCNVAILEQRSLGGWASNSLGPRPKPTPAWIAFSIAHGEGRVILEAIYALDEVWGRD